MKRLIWIGVVVLGMLGLAVLWRVSVGSLVTIQPGSAAVVTDAAGETTVLEAGVHGVPSRAEVVIYGTMIERLHRIGEAVVVDECPVAVELIYSVGDVVAFHESGGDFGAIGRLDAEVRQSLAGMDVRLDAPLHDVAMALREDLSGVVPDGLQIVRVNMDPGPCWPEPPRVVMQRSEQIALEPAAALGAERVPLGEVSLVSGEGDRFELERAVASYDVIDGALARACFGDRAERVADTVWAIVQNGVRARVGATPSVDISGALAAMGEGDPTGRSEQMRAECGLQIGGLDLSEAVLWRMERVDCGESPDAAVCRE